MEHQRGKNTILLTKLYTVSRSKEESNDIIFSINQGEAALPNHCVLHGYAITCTISIQMEQECIRQYKTNISTVLGCMSPVLVIIIIINITSVAIRRLSRL